MHLTWIDSIRIRIYTFPALFLWQMCRVATSIGSNIMVLTSHTTMVLAALTLFILTTTATSSYDVKLALYRKANGNFKECSRKTSDVLKMDTLSKIIKQTDVILTATVKSVRLGKKLSAKEHTYTATAEIKRVIKGAKLVEHTAHGRHHNRVNIDGLGNETVCGSFVLDGDTRVFFLKSSSQKFHFSLATTALRISRDTLRRVDAVVRSITYSPATDAPKRPCETHFCSFGAQCFDESGLAECRCISSEECPQEDDPVCGSDDVTYDSECLLRRESCERQQRVRVKHAGECETGSGEV